nr:MAG: replication associated protein [Arizlama virus]
MAIRKTRAFVITNFELNTISVFENNKEQIRFIAFGEETCPTTSRKHHQVFLYFHNPKSTGVRSLQNIGKLFGKPQHVEPMRGSFQQNESYCSKEGIYTKLGEEPKQGARGDLMETKQCILDGTITVRDVLIEDPHTIHMYGRTLDLIQAVAMRRKFRTQMTEGLWYWGKTGVGKSHKAFENYNPDTHYVKDLDIKWWDGYEGQEIIILNEFRGQITFGYLLSLMDKWPMTVPIRNKESLPFISKKIIITSSQHPKDIFVNILNNNERLDQLERRCKIVELVKFMDP